MASVFLLFFYPLRILITYIAAFIFIRIQQVEVEYKLKKIFSHNGGPGEIVVVVVVFYCVLFFCEVHA